MVKSRSDALFHLVLLALAGGFLQQAFSLPANAAGGSLSPAFFPRMISSAILVLLTLSLVRGLLAGALTGHYESPGPSMYRSVAGWFLVLVLLLLYARFLEPVGYVLTTSVFLFGCVASVSLLTRRRGERFAPVRVGLLALFSVGVSAAIFLIFSIGFEIVLPTSGVMGV